MNGYTAMVLHNAIVALLALIGMYITKSAWPLIALFFLATYEEE